MSGAHIWVQDGKGKECKAWGRKNCGNDDWLNYRCGTMCLLQWSLVDKHAGTWNMQFIITPQFDFINNQQFDVLTNKWRVPFFTDRQSIWLHQHIQWLVTWQSFLTTENSEETLTRWLDVARKKTSIPAEFCWFVCDHPWHFISQTLIQKWARLVLGEHDEVGHERDVLYPEKMMSLVKRF